MVRGNEGENMAEHFKLNEVENETFYVFPKGLLLNPLYRELSNTARIVYAILRDRMELSKKNGWVDEEGNIFLIFPVEHIGEIINANRSTVLRALKALKDVGLIKTVRQGLTMPNKVYVMKLQKCDLSKCQKCDFESWQKCDSNDTDYFSDTKSNDTDMGAKPKKKRKAFIPPTYEEVEAYRVEKGYHFDSKRFIEHYEASDWHLGNGKKVRYWKQCCATWEGNENKHSSSKYGMSKEEQAKRLVEETLAEMRG